MKIIYIIIISIFFFNYGFSQEKQIITILYSGYPNFKSEKLIELYNLANSKKSFKKKYIIEVFNLYDINEKLTLPLDNNTSVSNRIYKNEKDFETTYNRTKEDGKTYIYIEDPKTNISSQPRIDNLTDLFKYFKKIKNGNIKVFWFNGWTPYFKEPKQVEKLYETSKKNGSFNEIIPAITTPEIDEHLRPDQMYYTIEFLGNEVFDNYEVEIRKNNDNAILFKEVIVVDNEISSKDYFIYRTGFGQKLKLNLSQELLGFDCVKKFTNIIPDKTCDCKYDCLYEREWKIKIRGYNGSLIKDDLWSNQVGPFFFQCNLGSRK
jgi:hypothetical protein